VTERWKPWLPLMAVSPANIAFYSRVTRGVCLRIVKNDRSREGVRGIGEGPRPNAVVGGECFHMSCLPKVTGQVGGATDWRRLSPFGVYVMLFCRPSGAGAFPTYHSRLAPLRQTQGKLWAASFRRFAAWIASRLPLFQTRSSYDTSSHETAVGPEIVLLCVSY
jgi:hypothetical protein